MNKWFFHLFNDTKFLLAAVSHPKFKLYWIDDPKLKLWTQRLQRLIQTVTWKSSVSGGQSDQPHLQYMCLQDSTRDLSILHKLCGRPPQYAATTSKLNFDLLTLKVGYLCAILVFLGLYVLDLGPMYVTDRHTDVRRHTDMERASSLNAPAMGAGHNKRQAVKSVFLRFNSTIPSIPKDCSALEQFEQAQKSP